MNRPKYMSKIDQQFCQEQLALGNTLYLISVRSGKGKGIRLVPLMGTNMGYQHEFVLKPKKGPQSSSQYLDQIATEPSLP